jgi:spermidine synthase
MTILLDRRDDGSLALFYDGDLQFDSRDERVYHEALALPALALAERRRAGPLRALICGGGDGLAARELLKSPRLARLDLVDHDPAMLALARGVLASLNERSLADRRVRVVAGDAWAFVARALAARRAYDLILIDLTVPQEVAGARFHTVDWYTRLARLLRPDGLLAANAASPSGNPAAYWSIYNAVRVAGLQPLPYRVALPSFAGQGYGDDWGFVLASPRAVTGAELGDALPLATPRQTLPTAEHLRRLCRFPAASAAHRATARPARLGSTILLQYLYNGAALADATDLSWDALTADHAAPPAPPADDGRGRLPAALQTALATPIGRRAQEEALFRRVIALMPALHRAQTRAMIATFLAAPARFLAGVDLPALVDRLLRRAAELPRRLVTELRRLRRALARLAGDHERLLGMGLRVVTIVTLVVIVANLLYPDAVYGKGGDPGGGAASRYTSSLAAPSRSTYDPRISAPDLATGNGYRAATGRVALDEGGTIYPARRYYGISHSSLHRSPVARHPLAYGQSQPPAQEPDEADAAYRLTPDTDILPDGRVVIALNDDAYLMVGSQVSVLMDQQTRQPLVTLDREPLQVWRTVKEVERQRDGLRQSAEAKQAWIAWMSWLQFAPWHADDQRELVNLQTMAWRLEQARVILGSVAENPPPAPAPPVANAVEAFSGVWLLPDGSGLALRLPDGVAYLDGRGWYRDQARTQPLGQPYPTAFRAFMLDFLGQQVRERDASRARLDDELKLAQQDLAELMTDKAEYDEIARTESPAALVEYGAKEIPLQEAQRLTNAAVAQAQQRIVQLQAQQSRLPAELALAERVIASLNRT